MSLSGYKSKLAVSVVISLAFCWPVPGGANVVVEVDRNIEEWNLSLLARVQKQEGVKLQPFTTDGCSGGLSKAWNSFADILPGFKQKFGAKPPWEHCCIEHDRSYWKGEIHDGYQKRLQADQTLRQCVIQYGKENSGRLAEKFSVQKDKIEQQFYYAAELMYRAVRLGGKPCSLLPWRWGYGWPHCKVIAYPNSGDAIGPTQE
ncbi:MAG: hypothetical protein PVG75_02255 [Thioalkalispiraceae bacterium]|jgi:hypothetical protein